MTEIEVALEEEEAAKAALRAAAASASEQRCAEHADDMARIAAQIDALTAAMNKLAADLA